MSESLPGRWLRRYKLFFFLGLLILCGQLFLAYLLPIFGNADDEIGSAAGAQNGGAVTAAAAGTDDENSGPIKRSSIEIQSTLPTPASAQKKFHLRLDELTFRPSCTIDTKEAVSAIHRARTQQCKETIANITCAIQAGTFYPHELPNSCPAQATTHDGNSLGCFRDEKKMRILSGYYTNFKELNSPAKCMQRCLQSGFIYAGVQYS